MFDGTGVGVTLLSVLLIYAMFSDEREDEELEIESGDTDNTNLEIKDFKGRSVKMSCQTCRKLKIHREVEPDLWQCAKCKRHIDLRRVS